MKWKLGFFYFLQTKIKQKRKETKKSIKWRKTDKIEGRIKKRARIARKRRKKPENQIKMKNIRSVYYLISFTHFPKKKINKNHLPMYKATRTQYVYINIYIYIDVAITTRSNLVIIKQTYKKKTKQ